MYIFTVLDLCKSFSNLLISTALLFFPANFIFIDITYANYLKTQTVPGLK